MRIAIVDESATLGTSLLHRASPVAKVIAFVLVLAAVIANANVLVIGGIALVLASAMIACRLPLKQITLLAAYPAFFALVFGFGTASPPLTAALFAMKAVTAALAALLLIFTTPYPQVFAPVQRVVPGIVGDAMLMTYRSVFLLLEKFNHLMIAVRLRAGLSGRKPVRSARATIHALGGLLLYAFDLSQRDYDVMRLRGYEGRIRAKLPPSTSRARDTAVLGTAATVLALSVIFRMLWFALNPFSWLVPVVGLVALVAALLYRWRFGYVPVAG